MGNKIQISIPKLCGENWNAMAMSEKGKFCASCQKNVIDFKKFSDREILNYYNTNSNICGKFSTIQLNRNLIIPQKKNTFWMIAVATLIAFLGIGKQTAIAQEAVKTELTDKKQNNDSEVPVTKGESTYFGIVYDENKTPLPAVNVTIKGTKISTVTNFCGEFSIKAKKGDVLLVSYIGYENLEKKLSRSQKINVYIKLESMLLGEVIVIEKD